MIFTERIEKLLGSNHIREVIDEFLKFLSDVPQGNRDARNDANQLRGQVIILSGRYTDLNTKINTNTIDAGTANQEKSVIINSFVQILNQIPSSHPDLNNYMNEKNEDDEWKEAQQKNTIEEYQDYFSKYPNGKYKAATISLIAELEEVKQKQDAEIKRLASLEKERRENDKAAEAIPPKTRSTTTQQKQYSTNIKPAAAPASGSRKGLYIALGALLGVFFIIIIAVAVADEPAAPVTPVVDNNIYNQVNTSGISESVKAELISAIRLGNNAQISAYYSLSADYLYKSFIGEALKTGLTEIETLRTNDLFVTSTMESQQFINFKLSDNGDEAEVELEEVWTTMYSRISTQECFSKTPAHKIPQTMFLKKTENGWMISSIVHKNSETPQNIPCNS